jgi:alpha-glucosidase
MSSLMPRLKPMIAAVLIAMIVGRSEGVWASAPERLSHTSSGVTAQAGSVRIEVTALDDGVLRVRVAKQGSFPEDASWAVPADQRARRVPVSATADGFATRSIAVHLSDRLGISVTDRAG